MRVKKFFGLTWRPAIGYSVALVAAASLLFFRLRRLTPGLSQPELATSNFSSDFHNIIYNPLYAPYTVMQWVLHKINLATPLSLRAVSVFWALVILVFFYMLLRHWFSLRMAIIGTTLLATSSWFLHSARLATPTILLMSLVVLVTAGLSVKHSTHHKFALLLAVGACALALYIPGLVWFVLFGIIWQRRRITKDLRSFRLVTVLAAGLIMLVLILPLIWAFWRNPHLLLSWVGIPQTVASFPTLANNAVHVPLHLFIRGPANPVIWLGRVPILDVFTSVMFILGLYTYWLHLRLEQANVANGILVIGVILIALGGPVNVTLLLPWIYLVAITGLVYFWQEWLSVFPRNPVARGLGNGLVLAAIVVTCSYHLLHYFVAWPHSPVTRQAFSIQLPPRH